MQVTRVAPGWPVPSLMHRRRVMADRITYVGLDVHKEGIVVAVAEGGLRGEVREYGRIANTAGALDRLMRKLGGAGVGLRFCDEAGPCGYGIQRHLSAHGHECVVVAPSLIPKRARCMRCAGRASSSRAFCCGRAAVMGDRLGPSYIAPTGQARGLKAHGWRGSSSRRRCIISCSRTTSRRSRPPRPGAIG